MSKLEKSSNKIVSFLRRKPAFEGQVVHRSEEGIIHQSVKQKGKIRVQPAVQFVRGGLRRFERNNWDLSILEKSEIEDLGKVYDEVRLNFNFKNSPDTLRMDLDLTDQDTKFQDQSPSMMNSSKVKELYFKNREEKKMNKLNTSLQKMAKNKMEEESLITTYKSSVNNKILNFVKTKNRLSYESNNQQEYRSEINRSFFDTNHAKVGNIIRLKLSTPEHLDKKSGYQRQNIISLETGLPARPYIQLSSFRQKVEQREQLFDPSKKLSVTGVRRNQQEIYSVNLPNGHNGQSRSFTPNQTSIVSSLNEYFGLMEDENKKTSQKKKSTWIPKGDILDHSNRTSQTEKYTQLRQKVEYNELNLVNCCEKFLSTKKYKNSQFINLIQTADRDRSMTQQIRLRLYTGEESKRQRLTQLRRSAEKQRQQRDVGNNLQHQWYETLVEQISKIKEDHETLKICDFVFDELKNILEDGSLITKIHVIQLVEAIDQDENMILNDISVLMLQLIAKNFGVKFQDFRIYTKFKKYLDAPSKEIPKPKIPENSIKKLQI